ncbi:hypothetical protein LG204_07710 [Methylovorus menthalis]|uniref:hypothetical protein n=1 Tax=Methylovorus menthalis TaxID=1002227 RepID=UPI001E417BA8|nr:hypothetical protein [Methylovorus menthalis]MCB4811197.1 hypothetical protein [Methylovorus menthalis]
MLDDQGALNQANVFKVLPWQQMPNRKSAGPEAVFAAFLGKMPNFHGDFSGMILAMYLRLVNL